MVAKKTALADALVLKLISEGTLEEAMKGAARARIVHALWAHNWCYGQAAQELGITERQLYNLRKEHRIRRPTIAG